MVETMKSTFPQAAVMEVPQATASGMILGVTSASSPFVVVLKTQLTPLCGFAESLVFERLLTADVDLNLFGLSFGSFCQRNL
jgi:hypothetical protein